MARIRTVKPELFTHEGLFEAEQDYQLPLRVAFIGLLTQCDQWGRFYWEPRRLRLGVLPYDDVDMAQVLGALVARGFIKKYEAAGRWYGCIPSWAKHQRITRPEHPSGIPAPEGFIAEGQFQKKSLEEAKIQSLTSLEKPLEDKGKETQPFENIILDARKAIAVLVPEGVPLDNPDMQATVEEGYSIIDAAEAFTHTENKSECDPVVNEHSFLQTNSEEDSDTSDTNDNRVHIENVLGCNTVCTKNEHVRTRCTGNKEYGNGIGKMEKNVEWEITLLSRQRRDDARFLNPNPFLKSLRIGKIR